MLILTRSAGQKIMIGEEGPDQIVIEVLSIHGTSRCRIGVQAPLSVPVHREEIYERIHKKVPS
jgi:carbon storage regulator